MSRQTAKEKDRRMSRRTDRRTERQTDRYFLFSFVIYMHIYKNTLSLTSPTDLNLKRSQGMMGNVTFRSVQCYQRHSH